MAVPTHSQKNSNQAKKNQIPLTTSIGITGLYTMFSTSFAMIFISQKYLLSFITYPWWYFYLIIYAPMSVTMCVHWFFKKYILTLPNYTPN
jgi:hypothetical protein